MISTGDGKWVVLDPEALGGERIIIATKEWFVGPARAKNPRLVVYSPSEIEELSRASGGNQGFIRSVHALKKMFDGELIPYKEWKKNEFFDPRVCSGGV